MKVRRRSILGGSVAVVAGAALPVSSADAQLGAIGTEAQRLSADYSRMLAKWWTIQPGDPQLEAHAAKMDGPHGRLSELSDQVVNMRATSPEAWKAKAILIRHAMTIEHNTMGQMVFDSPDQEVVWSLVNDLVGAA